MRRPASLLLLLAAACSREAARPAAAAPDAEPVVRGDTVDVPPAQRLRFALSAAAVTPLTVSLTVPARTVAERRTGGGEGLLLFEDMDAQALYSEYLRDRTAAGRTGVQLARLRELYARSAVAGKDVTDAESDAQQASTTLRETEGKLRQAGYDPALLAGLAVGEVLAVADVPENQSAAARRGAEARLELAAYPGEPVTGRVVAVGETVDPDTRTVRMTIALGNPGGRIKPGMFARARIAEQTAPALQIPLSAVVSADARDFVFVRLAPGRFVRREIVTALDDGQLVEVKSGLAPGDSVVTTGAILLKGLTFGY